MNDYILHENNDLYKYSYRETSLTLQKQTRKYIFFVIKWILAIGPLAWIIFRTDLGKLYHVIQNIAWWTLPAVTFFIGGAMFLQGVRWWLLMRAFIPDLKFTRMISYHFIGLFYSLVLPSSAAQDVVRTVLASKKHDYSVSWGATWLCRILGLFVLAAFSLYSLMNMELSLLPPNTINIIFTVFLLIALLLFLSFSKKITAPIRSVVQRFLPEKIMRTAEKIREAVYNFRDKKAVLVQVLLITVVTHGFGVLNACFIIKGITGRFYFMECLAFLPIIEIISTSLPITPNGVGVRESLMVLMFNFIGLSKEHLGTYVIIGIYALLLRLVGIVPVLIGSFKKKD